MFKIEDETIEVIDFDEISLEEVTEKSLRSVLKLEVAKTQKKFVAPNAVSISQAYFSKTAWFRAICYKKVPLGFVMLDINEHEADYFLWRFMVDQRFQGNHIGTKAMDLIVAHVKKLPKAKYLVTSCVPGEGSPDKFYEKYGFVATGQVEENENVYQLKL